LEATGYFSPQGALDGIVTIVGTDSVQFAELLAYAPSGRCFFSGSIINMTPQECRLQITTEGFQHVIISIPEYGGIHFKKHPMTSIRVAVNGTVRIKGFGFIVDEETKQDFAMLLANETIEVVNDVGRNNTFSDYTHTDITTATTTTITTPSTGHTLRIYKAMLSTQGAARPVLQWTDSDGTSNVNIIGGPNYGAEGSWIWDFGDRGLHCPNGVGGLLRLVSNNTAVLDVDVISRVD